MPKDETRMVSHKGHAIARFLKAVNNRHAANLLTLQKYAWETKNLKLAEMITALMEDPQFVNMALELWTENEIDALIALIEAGE
jgi:hypothetical protein